MADIKPTPPVTPPLGQSTAQPTLGLSTILPVQLIDLPEALLAVQQQINLTGVLRLATENQLALSTALGQILFSLPQLRTNPLLLQQLLPFIESGRTAQLHIAPSPDGVLHGNLTLSVTTPTTATPLPTPHPGSLIGKDVVALVLPHNSAASALSGTASPPHNAEASTTLPKLAQQFLQLHGGTAQHPSQSAAASPPPQLAQLHQGMNLRIQQFVALGQQPQNLAADEFIATVTGFSIPLQQPVLLVGNIPIMLKTGTSLPVGSMVVLKLPPTQTPDIAPDAETGGKIWPALQQLVAQTQATESPPLQHFTQNRVPQMNQALGGAMLFMLAAFNRGDVRQWLGQNAVETLERSGRKDLIAAMQDEMRDHMSTATDPVVGQWRGYHLPYLAQGQLAPLQIYVHHDDVAQDGAEKPSGRKTRFIIDVTFTRLGVMQFDGFVQQKKFDLMLRSEQTLEPGLRHELRYAFTEAVGAVGYTGQLLFQQGAQGWTRFIQGKHETLQA